MRKAAAWAFVSALALFGATEFGTGFYPTYYAVLNAIGFGLLLPVIASLHVRHDPVRRSGAVLGTIAATCVVVLGLFGLPETSPATLIVRLVWWWTIGKMWAETGVLPPAFGWLTMGLAVASVAIAGAARFEEPSSSPTELLLRLALSAWLVALAFFLWRPAR